MKADEPDDPSDIRTLCTDTVMAGPNNTPNLIYQTWLTCHDVFPFPGNAVCAQPNLIKSSEYVNAVSVELRIDVFNHRVLRANKRYVSVENEADI